MELIDKYALVAKIEEIKNNANKRGAIGRISTVTLCNELLSFLDTLEVKEVDEELISEDLEQAAKRYATEGDEISGVYIIDEEVEAFKAGAKWQKEQIEKALLSEVLPIFMHGGEADEVVAKLDEVLSQKK